MNATAKIQLDQPLKFVGSKLDLDKKRYLWMISPALPVIGIAALLGYQFGPKKFKKV